MKDKAQIAIGISDQLAYALFLPLANYVGGVVGTICRNWLAFFWQIYFSNVPMLAAALIIYPIIWTLSLLIPFAMIYLLFRRAVPNHYLPSDEPSLWCRSALQLILPGELIRFLLCLSLRRNMVRFALFPSNLFDLFYLPSAGRSEAVLQEGTYILQDFAVYALIYLLYFALYLTVILLIYRRFWKVGKEEREDLFIRT